MTLNAYIWVALFSIIYTSWMLSKPGISREIKVVFLRKNIFYTIAFIVINSISLASTYWSFLDSIKPIDDNSKYIISPIGWRIKVIPNDSGGYDLTTIEYVSFIASLSSGLILAIVRSFEPYFIKIMKKNIWKMFGNVYEENEDTN